MPDPLHILLGANGDLCAMLPWMKVEAERTGRPVKVLVARDYLPLLDGVSYVTALEWPGTFLQLSAALRFVKTDLPGLPVKVLQAVSRIEDRTFPSFVHEMWYQAGALMEFGKLPLVFDRRDAAREAALVERVRQGDKPMILVAAHGKSSPFRWSKELLACIRKEFGKTHQIVDLRKVKAERFYDLLGLYDAAAALVTIDTGHVHLSRASEVPVFVLARDYPQLWDGVPYEQRFRFYCRYGAWKRRRYEMLRAVSDVLNHLPQFDMKPVAVPRHAYNPSAFFTAGNMIVSARYHPVEHDWKTRLTISNGTIKPVKLPARFNNCSHEDMRMFHHRGKLMASCTVARQHGKNHARCVTVFGELHETPTDWKLTCVRQPQFRWNDWRGLEKNWVFFSRSGTLYAIYGIINGRQLILQLNSRGEVTKTHWAPRPRWRFGEVRGGTPPLPHRSGHLIRFFHSRTQERGGIPWRYHIGAILMEGKPPFKVKKITREPMLSGTEEWQPGCHHWKPNVVFPCGALMCFDASSYRLTIGVNDAWSREVDVTARIL